MVSDENEGGTAVVDPPTPEAERTPEPAESVPSGPPTYVVQRAVEFEDPDKVLWEDFVTLEVPPRTKRPRIVELALAAREDVELDPEGEKFRVLDAASFEEIPVKDEIKKERVIG